jgi:peptidoglycan/xylan/chitin deacetylase (PgdA/CDA1 family)
MGCRLINIFQSGFLLIILMLVFLASCAPLKRVEMKYPQFAAVVSIPSDTFESLAQRYMNDPSMGWYIAEFNGLSSLQPGQELIVPYQTYGIGGISSRGYQVVPVLVYHKFSQDKVDRLTVTARAFQEQMTFLRDEGYEVISLDRFFDFLESGRQLPPKAVVITIDDGWRSFYRIAFPILKKFDYPATLFVYTDLIDGSRDGLDWPALSEMAAGGLDIQAHSKTHRNLATRDAEESFEEYFASVKNELTKSAYRINQKLNVDVSFFAYPYGDTNELVVTVTQKVGYKAAFTVERGGNPFFVNRYCINRSMVFGEFDINDFRRNLETFKAIELK